MVTFEEIIKNDFLKWTHILVKNLKEYGFMTKYPVSKNGCKYESSFYDKVNIGLSAFINCHKDFVEHKNVDW